MKFENTRRSLGAWLATLLAVVTMSGVLGAPTAIAAPDTPESEDTVESPQSGGGVLLDPLDSPASPQADTLNAPAVAEGGPYGDNFPIILEANFSQPYNDKGTSNYDYALLNDLERLIRGSYKDPNGKLKSEHYRKNTVIYVSVSRMESSVRVGRELIAAAKNGVKVRFIHGIATQSPASRSLMKKINAEKTGQARICAKGKSQACLSSLNGAITHGKIVMVSHTYTRSGDEAKGAVWTGSSNYGGRSAERTFNNGITVYNDQKLWNQMSKLWADMWAERNVGNDYPSYVKARSSSYGLAGATAHGYTSGYATRGMFYSNLANYTIYATPIKATPTNGRDPVLNMLNRIIPDDQCRIRLMENRFKYRRIAVAHKLVELNKQGCRISAIAFKDDIKSTWNLHCQQLIRICRPILDVFKTAVTEIDTAYAHPHDKTILVEANMGPNKLNPEELTPEGNVWPAKGQRTTLVLAGSAALTGSNLVMSDEITTETTDPAIYDQYLDHWKAASSTRPFGIFKY